jgi:hypothetical protein
MQRTSYILVLLFLIASGTVLAQKPNKEKREEGTNLAQAIWRDPGDVSVLNLEYGAGGRGHAPDPNGSYRFVKEDLDGTNPKFDVEDATGLRWRVKLGEESRTETAATRLLWAAGYFVDEDYYLPEITVTGLPRLHRGQAFVSPNGKVHGAGLERRPKEITKTGNWDWFANRFHDTREENGLRVMMALLNNWDLKTVNNSIEEVGGERRYLVTDLGATFGNTGSYLTRSKSVLKSYEDSKFIEHATPDSVDFVMHTRPSPLMSFRFHYYAGYVHMEQIVKHVPRDDAKWLTERLSKLSVEQIRDAFRGAGYAPEEIEGYAKVVQERIAALNAL